MNILDAPCIFCGYAASGYYRSSTHSPDCPWYEAGGLAERELTLRGVVKAVISAKDAANARIAELGSQLAERTAQLREVQGNWKKYEPFVSRMQEAEAKAANWKEAHERAAVIAAEELNKQRAEFEARLAEAKENYRASYDDLRQNVDAVPADNARLRAALELVLDRADRGAVMTAQRPVALSVYFKTYKAVTMRLSKEDFYALQAALAGEGEGEKK